MHAMFRESLLLFCVHIENDNMLTIISVLAQRASLILTNDRVHRCREGGHEGGLG